MMLAAASLRAEDGTAEAKEIEQRYQPVIVPLLKTYCHECHSDNGNYIKQDNNRRPSGNIYDPSK